MAAIDVLSGIKPYEQKYIPLAKIDRHLNTYANAINKMDAASKEALQLRNTMRTAINKAELHDSDAEFKERKLQEYVDALDESAETFGYSATITKARELAGNLASDKEFLAREKLYSEFKAEKEKVEKMDISDITKQRWLEQSDSSYNFSNFANVDSTGKVIGAKRYQGAFNPVTYQNPVGLIAQAVQLVAERSGSGSSATFVDEKGNVTKDANKGVFGVNSQTNSGYREKKEEELIDVFRELAQNAGVMASLKQDLDDRRWEIKKSREKLDGLSFGSPEYYDEERHLKSLESSITTDNGAPANEVEYALMKYGKTIKHASYRNTTSTTSWSNARNAAWGYNNTKNINAALAKTLGIDEGAVSLGFPTVVKLIEEFNDGNVSLNNSLNLLGRIMRNINQGNPPQNP